MICILKDLLYTPIPEGTDCYFCILHSAESFVAPAAHWHKLNVRKAWQHLCGAKIRKVFEYRMFFSNFLRKKNMGTKNMGTEKVIIFSVPNDYNVCFYFSRFRPSFPSSTCICWMAIWLSFTNLSPCGTPSLISTALMFSIFERQMSSLIVA